jgi:uncharacterized protein (DUF1810 family)
VSATYLVEYRDTWGTWSPWDDSPKTLEDAIAAADLHTLAAHPYLADRITGSRVTECKDGTHRVVHLAHAKESTC